MARTLRLVIRLGFVTAATSAVAAICLARANPERMPRRIASRPSYLVLGDTFTARVDHEPRLLDVETGRLEALPLPAGLGIGMASPSPWEEDGRRQVVGLGWDRSRSGPIPTRAGIGIVRISLPGGEVLDRVPLADGPLPAGPPCWAAGAPAGVVYPGQDGRIYRIDFESSDPLGGRVADPSPRPIRWGVRPPGENVEVRDLSWPDDPRLGGRLLGTISYRDGATGRRTAGQIWWLELDRGGSSIVAAGRLLEPAPGVEPGPRRLPALVSDGDGDGPALAYLARDAEASGYQLRSAPVRLDPLSGAPQAVESGSKFLAEDCAPAVLAASADGRFVTVLRGRGRSVRAERLAIAREGIGLAGAPRAVPWHREAPAGPGGWSAVDPDHRAGADPAVQPPGQAVPGPVPTGEGILRGQIGEGGG